MIKNFTSVFLAAILLLHQNDLFAQTNIALGKNVQASSIENASNVASNVNDGWGTGVDPATGLCTGNCTKWGSAFTDNESICIDLAAPYNLTGVTIYWETATASDFSIDISDDSTNWTTVETITSNSTCISNIDLTGHTARYVRMQGITRATAFGYSIWEFEITGTIVVDPGQNLALSGTAVASSAENPAVEASMVNDGSGGTGEADYSGQCIPSSTCSFWSSSGSLPDPQWIYIDLGSAKSLTQLILYWRLFNEANDFTIDVSDDGVDWNVVHSIADNTAHTNTFDMTGVTARYVRMQGYSRNNINAGYGLLEMEVYGFTATPITLYDFNARIADNNKEVEVKWSATLDFAGTFIVERSENGKDFTGIGTINESSGSGGIKKQYVFTDQRPLPGKNYYRLKYTEIGSATEYSRLTSVNFAATGNLVVYPNPVQAGKPIYVDLNKAVKGDVEFRVMNALGTVIYKRKIYSNGNSVFEIPSGSLTQRGNYIVQVTGQNGVRQSKIIYIK